MNPFEFDSVETGLDDFSGIARLFPIPNMVMFPHVVQPLHVFEERYREMMADALVGDSLIAMPVLKPGWEPDYASRPPLEPSACLGRVVLHKKLPDGCYNLLLLGLSRVTIERELDPLRSFRQAEVSVIDEVEPVEGDPQAQSLLKELSAAFEIHIPQPEASGSFLQMLNQGCPLGRLTDLMAYALPLASSEKQQLLGEPSVVCRAEQLLAMLGDLEPLPASPHSAGGFPPPFSDN